MKIDEMFTGRECVILYGCMHGFIHFAPEVYSRPRTHFLQIREWERQRGRYKNQNTHAHLHSCFCSRRHQIHQRRRTHIIYICIICYFYLPIFFSCQKQKCFNVCALREKTNQMSRHKRIMSRYSVDANIPQSLQKNWRVKWKTKIKSE
jgi:hypothetical protein